MKTVYLAVIICLCLVGCVSNSDEFPKAENAFDAGREFIDGCLKGDFKRAAFYMVNDTENSNDLQQIKKIYKEKSADQQQNYYKASIIVNEDETVSDTVHVINYMNSYDKVARKVKVVLRNNAWQVDFKYTFNGNL